MKLNKMIIHTLHFRDNIILGLQRILRLNLTELYWRSPTQSVVFGCCKIFAKVPHVLKQKVFWGMLCLDSSEYLQTILCGQGNIQKVLEHLLRLKVSVA